MGKPSKSAERAAKRAQEEANRIQNEQRLIQENMRQINQANLERDDVATVLPGGEAQDIDPETGRRRRRGSVEPLSSTVGISGV